MMMERAKTAPAPETTSTEHEKPSAPAAPATAPANASAEERVQDLERRLGDLGGPSSTPAPEAAAPAAEKPKQAQTGQNNPLLKRIQAAQERARQAEQKEKEAAAAATAEIEREKREEEETKMRAIEEARIAKAQSALRSVAGRALEDKQKNILAQLEGKAPVAPPAAASATTAAPEQAVPIMKTMDPPPPSFDSMKFPPPKEMQQQLQQPYLQPQTMSPQMVGHGMNSKVLTQQQQQQAAQPAAPPSFAFVENQMTNIPVEAPPAPTAPALTPTAPAPPPMATMDHLQGIMPVAPPMGPPAEQQQHTQVAMPPPPSFAMFESQQKPAAEESAPPAVAQDDDGVFDYDMDGNPMSPEQRQAMLEEQRLLYESIMKEKAANDAAISQASADAFDLRSSSAAAAAMPGGTTTHAAHTRAMDSVGQDAAAAGGASAESSAEAGPQGRMVKIGENQMVALHGQDRTKKAIKEGTAILVQCINCQNWMQVTDTATLMFCPVCQVVSPVIQQNEVMTKEEAIQLTMDRKLAEKLQAEAYTAGDEEGEGEKKEEGFMERFFGGIGGAVMDAADGVSGGSPNTSATAGAAASARQGSADSWWDKISSVVGYGVEKDRADMGVARPPGAPAAQYPADRRGSSTTAASVNDSTSRSPHQEETRGLLSPVVDGDEPLPARVAESKPLFSCIADSVNTATSSMFGTGQMDGVDGSSLLVTNAGRGVGDGAGDYSRVESQE